MYSFVPGDIIVCKAVFYKSANVWYADSLAERDGHDMCAFMFINTTSHDDDFVFVQTDKGRLYISKHVLKTAAVVSLHEHQEAH